MIEKKIPIIYGGCSDDLIGMLTILADDSRMEVLEKVYCITELVPVMVGGKIAAYSLQVRAS